jgi:hypothetical protein
VFPAHQQYLQVTCPSALIYTFLYLNGDAEEPSDCLSDSAMNFLNLSPLCLLQLLD